jgi:hypothetical protein
MKKTVKNTARQSAILLLFLISIISISKGTTSISYHQNNLDYHKNDSTPVYFSDSSKRPETLEKSYPKTARAFNRNFPKAVLPVWIQNEQSLYVYYYMAESKQMACFSLDGRLIYAIGILDKTKYPEYIKKQVLKNYQKEVIKQILEITSDDSKIYEILVEKKGEYLLFQAHQDDVFLVKKINKPDYEKYSLLKTPFSAPFESEKR